MVFCWTLSGQVYFRRFDKLSQFTLLSLLISDFWQNFKMGWPWAEIRIGCLQTSHVRDSSRGWSL